MNKEYKQVWRFYCQRSEPSTQIGECIVLDSEESHLALQVLRLKEGELIEIADGFGWTALAQIASVRKRQIEALVQQQSLSPRQKFLRILVVGLTKPGALDESVQAAVEAGADHLIVFKGDRSSSKQEFKTEKIRRQVLEMTRITKSPWCLDVSYEENLESALRQCLLKVIPEKLALFVCDERPVHESSMLPSLHLLRCLSAKSMLSWACVIGPESSFSSREYDVLNKFGHEHPLDFVGLGPRILRTPAAVSAAAWMMASLSECKSIDYLVPDPNSATNPK